MRLERLLLTCLDRFLWLACGERVRFASPSTAMARTSASRPAPRAAATTKSLSGLTFEQSLAALRSVDGTARETLLESLPSDSPLHLALRYRVEDASASPSPRRKRALPPPSPPASELASMRMSLDLSTASVEELTKLPGIGPARARTLVAERQRNGPFKSMDDLRERVGGIGGATAAAIATLVTFTPSDEAS